MTRNALIAAGNSADRSLLPAITPLLDDGSPLVRAMAVWALGRLAAPADHLAGLRAAHFGKETDASVLAEWVALGPSAPP